MNYIIAGLVFVVVALLVVVTGSIIINRRGQVQDRLTNIQKMSFDADPEEVLRLPFLRRVVAPAISGLGHRLANIAPKEIRSRMEKRIMYAGRPGNLTFYSLLALQFIVGGAFLALSLMLLRLLMVDGIRMVLFVGLLTVIGFFIPYVVVGSKAEARQQAIRRSLPDALDMLLVSVEAGLGFDMALKRVSQQMRGPLSEEFKQALDEIRMGSDRETALRRIAQRCGVSELSSFISAVIQSEQLGSDIAKTLRVQADFMRQKRRQLAQEKAMKAPVKLIFPLLFFIFPALFVVILGPAGIRIFQVFAGL